MYYLRIEKNDFGFITEDTHEILDNDISITKEEYQEFFDKQFNGLSFKLKEDPIGAGLFDCIEECESETIQQPEDISEKVKILEEENAELLKDSAIKDMRIEQLENDIADIMKEIALGGLV